MCEQSKEETGAMTSEYTPFSGIVAELKKLCGNKATGTLFIATKKKRAAQIMIENGRIVFLYFSNKRGQDALMPMSKIQAATFRFQAGKVLSKRMPLPETSSILKILAGKSSRSGPVAKPPPPGGAPGAIKPLGDDQKAILEECFAEYIGPMAAIICKDIFKKKIDFSTAIESLAAKISSMDQRKEFKEKVLSRT